MTALAIICSLTFPTGLTFRVGEFMKFSPIFIITALVGSIYGWKESALVALLCDIIQGLIFGNISILIALANCISGCIFGLLLKGTKSKAKISLAVIITQIVCSLGMISAVLFLRYGQPVFPTIYWRILQTAILISVQIPILFLIIRTLSLPEKIKNLSK